MPKPSNRGFTLVEVVVSIGLFALIMLIVGGIFISVTKAQKRVRAAQEGLESLRATLEIMAKEIRTAQPDRLSKCASGSEDYVYYVDAFESGILEGDKLSFLNAEGKCISYYLDNERIYGSKESISLPISSANFKINNLGFLLNDYLNEDDQPRATIKVSAESARQDIGSSLAMKLQTTISARNYDYLIPYADWSYDTGPLQVEAGLPALNGSCVNFPGSGCEECWTEYPGYPWLAVECENPNMMDGCFDCTTVQSTWPLCNPSCTNLDGMSCLTGGAFTLQIPDWIDDTSQYYLSVGLTYNSADLVENEYAKVEHFADLSSPSLWETHVIDDQGDIYDPMGSGSCVNHNSEWRTVGCTVNNNDTACDGEGRCYFIPGGYLKFISTEGSSVGFDWYRISAKKIFPDCPIAP